MVGDFRDRVEAARLGVVFAHDAKAYRRWRGRVDRATHKSNALTGAALEAAVMALARSHPEYVQMGA